MVFTPNFRSHCNVTTVRSYCRLFQAYLLAAGGQKKAIENTTNVANFAKMHLFACYLDCSRIGDHHKNSQSTFQKDKRKNVQHLPTAN